MPFNYIICTLLGFVFFLAAIFAPINLPQIKIYLTVSSIVLCGLSIFKDATSGLVRFKVNGSLLFCIAMLGLIMLNKLLEASIYMIIISFGKLFQDIVFAKFLITIKKPFYVSRSCIKTVDDKAVECSVDTIYPDDIILLSPNQKCPVDAIVIKGQGEIKPSVVGEKVNSNLVQAGDIIYAGSSTKDCSLTLKVLNKDNASFLQTAFNCLSDSIEQIQNLENTNYSNSYAKRILTFIVFMALPFFVFKVPMLSWIEYSIIALLVFSPYNSIIKSSIILFAKIIKTACQNSIIINNPSAMRSVNNIKALALEKNIILSKNKLIMSNVFAPYPFSRHQVLQAVSNLTTAANHPLAKTITQNACAFDNIQIDKNNVSLYETQAYNIKGKFLDNEIVLGTNAFLQNHQVKTNILLKKYSEYLTNGCSVLFVAIDGQPAGLIAFIDDISPSIFNIIKNIRSGGLNNIIFLNQTSVFNNNDSNSNTTSKIANIKRLHYRYGDIMVVGNTKDDLPSLKAADISVSANSMHNSNQVDITIIANNLTALPELFRLSYAYTKTINLYKKFYLFCKIVLLILTFLSYIYLWQVLLIDCLIGLILLLNYRFIAKL